MSRQQLLLAGVSERIVHRQVANGRLLTLHRGVYAVGHERLRDEGRWLAAVLAGGPGALLSHRAAAALHGLRPDNRPRIEVSVPGQRRATAQLQIHGRRVLEPVDRTVVDGVPATTVARTLVDLAAVVPAEQLQRAVRRADEQRTFDLGAVAAALERTCGRRGRGHAAMRALLAEQEGGELPFTRSPLEDRFLALVARSGLPAPRTNVWFDELRCEVDALWRDARVVVELDSWRHHGTRDAFQRDRRKANALTLRGWCVLRFTYDDVERRPNDVTAALRGALESVGLRGAVGAAP